MGPHGTPLAYYDDGTRVLRVLGRVVPAPPGRTLVALIGATGPRAAEPRVVLRIVPTPTAPAPRPDFAPLLGAGVVSYVIVGEYPAWTAALRADPVVRALMDEGRVRTLPRHNPVNAPTLRVFAHSRTAETGC